MEACSSGDMGFQQESNAVTNCESIPMSEEVSAIAMSSMTVIPKPSNVHHDPRLNHPNFGCPLVVSHRDFAANFPFPPVPLWENQKINLQLANYPSPDSSFIEMVPMAQCFTSLGLPDMVGPAGLPQCDPIANPMPHYASNVEDGASAGTQNRERGAMGSPSSERRRKRTPDSNSPYEPNKNDQGESRRDPSGGTFDVQGDHNEKKHRTEQPKSTDSRGKQTKDNSNNREPLEENYVHVRARRGHATNSHSLAERVRREKISERMRLLQELVPGCNKITGKAMMLDEIINYVQSLQQQVEFLSMKLATLLPDLGTDLERVLSKEILQERGKDSVACGLVPRTGLFLPHGNMPGIPRGALPSTSQYFSLPQVPLDNELQTLFQVDFNSTSAVDTSKHNGRLKPEQ